MIYFPCKKLSVVNKTLEEDISKNFLILLNSDCKLSQETDDKVKKKPKEV